MDRRSRYIMIPPLTSKHATHVGQEMIDALDKLNKPVHTITSDNGKDFADYVNVSHALKADFYFARHCASWERGTNGLLRQFFPKHSDFSRITNKEIEHAMQLLNNRPRKCLEKLAVIAFLD